MAPLGPITWKYTEWGTTGELSVPESFMYDQFSAVYCVYLCIFIVYYVIFILLSFAYLWLILCLSASLCMLVQWKVYLYLHSTYIMYMYNVWKGCHISLWGFCKCKISHCIYLYLSLTLFLLTAILEKCVSLSENIWSFV